MCSEEIMEDTDILANRNIMIKNVPFKMMIFKQKPGTIFEKVLMQISE